MLHRRNNVGQQLSTLLDVTCCVRLHTLLHVVAQSLKPVKLLSQQLPTFFLFRDRRSATMLDPCIALPTLRIIHGLLDGYKVLWVVSCPRCTAGPNIVGSYRIILHITTNTDATTPNTVGNIVGPTSHVALTAKFIGHIEKAYSGTIKQLKSP